MASNSKTIFEQLYAVDVNDHTEKKGNLTYLSWAWAWAEFVKVCPDAKYEVMKFDSKPYLFDEKLGYMVFTEITVGGDTKEMWLPVMDERNHSMTDHSYTYTIKYGSQEKEYTCKAATMFDINKTIMRCLVKNIAMFGLGLYIYAGEDVPGSEEEKEPSKATPNQIKTIRELYDEENINKILGYYQVSVLADLSAVQASQVIARKLKQ